MKNNHKDALSIDLRHDATSSHASLALGRVYLRSGCFKDAEVAARRAKLEEPTNGFEADLLLAEALLLQGRQVEAQCVRSELPEPIPDHLKLDLQILDARLLTEAGKYRECIEIFSTGISRQAASVADILLQQIVAESMARINDLGLLRRTVEWIVSESEHLGWTQGVADGLQKLGLLDRMEGHWARGDELLLRSREIYRTLGLSKKYVQVTLNLGLHRLFRGHLTFAYDALSEAVRLAVEIADLRFEATARADRGLALVRLDRADEARLDLAKSLRLCRRQASPRRTAIALEYTGELHLASHNYVRARAALRRALDIANKIAPDGDIVPEVLRRQAEVALALGDVGEALDLAKDAGARAERYGDRYEHATALRVQGQALRSLGKGESGEQVLRSALAILEELGETFERDRILDLLGELDDGAIETPLSHSVPTATPQVGSAGPLDRRHLQELARRHGLFGSSRRLMDVMRDAFQVSSLNIPVLIQGETGTGKELLAQAIHRMGRWGQGPMVAFNCATCPHDLLDAELFGHTRGAYTGAVSSRTGLVRAAEAGTLFLDEIGELKEDSQARLLRFLDSGEVRSLGSDETKRVQVRIVAATHVDLEERIRRNRFRRDLYFRLTGLRLVLPPLRERRSDIKELIARFTDEARSAIRPGFAGLSRLSIIAMERAQWPGNVRQLKSEILRLAALTPDGVIVDNWAPQETTLTCGLIDDIGDPSLVLEDPRRLSELLRKCDGRVADVATVLGVSRGHVYRVLKQLGIRPKAGRLDS